MKSQLSHLTGLVDTANAKAKLAQEELGRMRKRLGVSKADWGT
jgi:hypothetical protein